MVEANESSWVLPSIGDPSIPCDERLAGLPHEARVGWHSLRRKFASELKGIPLKDLCQLGGWKSAVTVLTCYQQPDDATMRRALEGRKRLGSAGVI